MSSIHYIVNVEAVIIREDQYLLIERGPEETHAAGLLSLVGGKVEDASIVDGILEATLRREIREEVGIEVAEQMAYLESKSFIANGEVVVDVVFLCPHRSGDGIITDPGEVAAIHWLTA